MVFDIAIHKTFQGAKHSPFSLQVSLQSQQNNIAIVGASGAGKSLFLQSLCGMVKPDNGYIQILDQMYYQSDKQVDIPCEKRRIAYLFQHYALFPHLTVAQNVAVAIEKSWWRPSKNKAAQLALPWLEKMAIAHLAHHFPMQISGGQRQRVALARALAGQPDVLLLDEPFSALNHELKQQMRQMVNSVLTAEKIPFVMATHDYDDIAAFDAQVWQMTAGKLDYLSGN